MDKFAELARDAEIRGVLSAFVDTGLVKVASDAEFNALHAAVTEKIGAEAYDLQKVAAVTEEVLSGGEAKQASETEAVSDEMLRNAALGELLQLKIAGQIDDATFQKTAGELLSLKKEAGADLGAAIGALRASKLSDEERAALKQHYGLADDASLGWRNAGRGSLGGVAGLIPGSIAGGVAGSALGKLSKHPLGGFIGYLGGSALGGVAGGSLGALAATNKYSRGNAEKIMAAARAHKALEAAPVQKAASEAPAEDTTARNAALGELLQMKLAGQIDDATFRKTASELLASREPDGVYRVGGLMQAGNLKAKGGRKLPLKAIGAGAAAVGTLGLGKVLYDKYKKKDA